jgi:hypothetical protein
LRINNLITGNGIDPKSPKNDRFGVERLASGRNTPGATRACSPMSWEMEASFGLKILPIFML